MASGPPLDGLFLAGRRLGKAAEPGVDTDGAALKGFWVNAIQESTCARPVIAFSWYRDFLQYLVNIQAWPWFAKLIVAGELAAGILLLLGAFTGIGAFIGGFMNWNFMLAGSASINPLLFTLSVLIMLAWKNAGYYGLDRWLLPLLGTPWRPAFVLRPVEEAQPAEAPAPRT